MEYIYGAMLLHKAGKDITSDALKATLSAAGIKVDDSRVKATAAALKDVDVEKVISENSDDPDEITRRISEIAGFDIHIS